MNVTDVVLPTELLDRLDKLVKSCGQLLIRLREKNPALREDLKAFEDIVAQIDDIAEDHRFSHEFQALYRATKRVLDQTTN